MAKLKIPQNYSQRIKQLRAQTALTQTRLAEIMGVTPAAVTTALTAGWALSAASSPFAATTMLVGNIARVSAWHIGLVWNGAYTALSALMLSAWVAFIASL